GIDDDEVVPFVSCAVDRGVDVRFIEYMPMAAGEGEGMGGSAFTVPSAALRERVEREWTLEPDDDGATAGPAETHRIAGARSRVGFISAMSNPFCESCNRLRITPE